MRLRLMRNAFDETERLSQRKKRSFLTKCTRGAFGNSFLHSWELGPFDWADFRTSRQCVIFPSLLRGTFGNLEATHDNSLGCLEVSGWASRQTSTYELGPRLDLRESLDLARPLTQKCTAAPVFREQPAPGGLLPGRVILLPISRREGPAGFVGVWHRTTS